MGVFGYERVSALRSMNIRALIDAVVRQTTVLIAQLATAGGVRAPLAHVASQVFLDLARELEAQGLSRKVSADMFGMALRTYQRRTQRMGQSQTDRGRSLWEAVFDFIGHEEVVTRQEILRRFRHDDEASLRGVLRDLTDSGLVFSSGSGPNTGYRLATQAEIGKMCRGDDAALEALVWSIVFRDGPATVERLSEVSGLPAVSLEAALASLIGSGKVEAMQGDGPVQYRSLELFLQLEDPAGWEASVLDHFSTVVKTISNKLNVDPCATTRDETGGSTYHFTISRGHPMADEVLGELRRFRQKFTKLRERVDRHNADHGLPEGRLRVDAYYGQCVVEEEDDDGESAKSG